MTVPVPTRPAGATTGPWYPPTAEGGIAPIEVHHEVSLFLALESEAFDDRRFDAWSEMLDDSFTYRVPVPVVRDNASGPPYDPGTLLIDETKESILDIWLARYGEQLYDVAWGEHPPLRFRHHVSNVRVRTTERSGVYLARSNVLLSMVRQATDPAQLGAERHDVIGRQPEGAWALLSRYCVLDAVVLDVPQVRVML